eukprot:tig00021501_g21947.t1
MRNTPLDPPRSTSKSEPHLLSYSHAHLRLDDALRISNAATAHDGFDYDDVQLKIGSAMQGSRSCLALDALSPRTVRMSPRQVKSAIKEGGECARSKDWSHAAAAFQDALNSNPFEPLLGNTFISMVSRLRRDRFYYVSRPRRGDALDFDWRPASPPPPAVELPPEPPPQTPPEVRKTIKEEFEEVYRNIYLKDLLPRRKDESAQQEAQLRQLLWRFYFYTRRVFKFYARIETPAVAKIGTAYITADPLFTVEKREWLNFVKDCRFENSTLTKAIIDIIYITANREIDQNGVPIEDESTEGNSKASCMMHEFLATIVRMGHERFRKTPVLGERVRAAYEELLVPNARVDDEAALKFEFLRRETQAVVGEFRGQMVEIFRTFSMLDWQQGSRDHPKLVTMSFREFNAFAEFFKLVDDVLTVKELQDAFVLAQKDPYVHLGKPPPDGEVTDAELLEAMGALDASDPTELQFEDFEEAVVRLGMAKIPNAAAKPLHDVIRTFYGQILEAAPAVLRKIQGDPALKAPDTLRARADAMWAERERRREKRRASTLAVWDAERRARSTQPPHDSPAPGGMAPQPAASPPPTHSSPPPPPLAPPPPPAQATEGAEDAPEDPEAQQEEVNDELFQPDPED